MKRKFPKILYLLVCFLLVFQQSGFAQGAGELNIPAHLNALRNSFIQDKFRPLHLRYISYDNSNNNFKLLLDKGDQFPNSRGHFPSSLLGDSSKESVLWGNTKLQEESKALLNYFFIGISLPNDSFWVNLRPDSPDNIIDPYLAQTDLGKILLEADLQLKKDTANFTSPQTPEGKEYWNKLYQKAGELFGSENITIPTLTRPWIVPNEIIIRESADNAYIYKATLKVMLEQDYLKDSATYNFTDERLKQLNEYSSQLIRETIIPKLTKDINTAKRYAPLRQVYYSLILAQWFKQKFQGLSPQGTVPGFYVSLIDRRNLTGLTSKEPWSKNTYFQAYQKSFKEGEYNIKEQVYCLGAQTIRNYMSGGIAITDIASAWKGNIVSASPVRAIPVAKNNLGLEVAGSQAATIPFAVDLKEKNINFLREETQTTGSSPVVYFDADQNKAMDLLKDDPQAWVVFADMLKLSLRNDYYGSSTSDIFIADAIRITKDVLSGYKGIGFRLGERSDEVAMVLPGSLQPQAVKGILQTIQGAIAKEYRDYCVARLPDGLVEKVKAAAGLRGAQRTARDNQGNAGYITTILFVKDGADINGRSTLDRILKESGLDSGLGEIEEALPPYLPAGAARLQGRGALENRFESSLKEAEIFQRVAKQANQLAGAEGLSKRPETREGARLDDSAFSKVKEYVAKFEASSKALRDFVKTRYGDNDAAQIKIDNGYAAFMRRNLYTILEYTIEKAKSADSFIFVVRGPPDNFYIITSAKGKWQITPVRQNILTAEGSSLEKDFMSIMKESRRKLRVEGKYPFKVVNDFEELGHYFGNQLIKLDNVSLLDAFNIQIAKAKEANGLLDERAINEALSEASRNISGLLSEKGFAFSVNFEAVSVTDDDFIGQENLTSAAKAAAALEIIEKLNSARKIVEIPDNSVKFYSEYKNRWPEIEKEIEFIAAKRAANAGIGLKEAHKNIGAPDGSSAGSSALASSPLGLDTQAKIDAARLFNRREFKLVRKPGISLDLSQPFTKRFVVIGDIHGDLEGLTQDLRDAGLVDINGNWIGGDAVLMQMGDIINRGERSFEAYQYLSGLRSQARAQGGDVKIVLGNHESMFFRGATLKIRDNAQFAKWVNSLGKGEFKSSLKDVITNESIGEARRMILTGKSGDFAKWNKLLKGLSEDIQNGDIRVAYEESGVLFVHAGVENAHSSDAKGEADFLNRKFANKNFDGIRGALWNSFGAEVTGRGVNYLQIVAHTPELKEGAEVRVSLNGKVVNVDVGHWKGYGGNRGYVEINGNKLQAYALVKESAVSSEVILLEQGFNADNRRVIQFEVNPFSLTAVRGSLRNQLVEAINSNQVIKLSLMNLASKDDKFVQAMAVFNLLEEILSEELFAKFKVIPYDLKNAVRELLMNAFFHGNKLDFSLPVYLYFDFINQKLEIYDLAVPQGQAWEQDKAEAEKAGIGGKGSGLKLLSQLGWSYKLEPVKVLNSDRQIGNKTVAYRDSKGGIDFRALPAVTQPMGIISGRLPAGVAPVIPLKELNNEWRQIENMLNAGITPSSDRLKGYLQSCYQKEDFNQDIDKVLSCIAGIFRFEEERADGTDPSLKEILAILESNKPASDMQVALAQITVEAKEPKLIEK
jgi:anti-sigma regulatory factor (Ser/Thr protein kinase)/GGDEF domain-containing protein